MVSSFHPIVELLELKDRNGAANSDMSVYRCRSILVGRSAANT